MVSAIDLTDAKSPGLETANPASITSTFSFSKALAIRSFSSLVIEAPGLCSPSRNVVSKIMSFSFFMLNLRFIKFTLYPQSWSRETIYQSKNK